MSIETKHRGTKRWIPEADPDRKNLERVLAFAYGMQMGHLRRIADELTQLARQARLATMAAGAAIAVEHQHRIECIARSGEAAPQLGSRPAANIGLAGECLRTALPQFCGDTETHPFVDRMHSRTFGVRSIVYVPVFRGVSPEGVIGVFADKPNHFTPHDVRVLQMMAREVTRTLKWELSPEVEPEPLEVPRDRTLEETLGAGEAIGFKPAPEKPVPVIPIQSELEKPVVSLGEALLATGAARAIDKQEYLPDEIRPLFEPDLTVSLEPPAEVGAEGPTSAQDAHPRSVESSMTETEGAAADFDWARQDVSYPARATSYLFAEDHPLRRMATIVTLAVLGVAAILAVWWAVPRLTADNNIEPTADYIAGKTTTHNPSAPPGRVISGELKPAGADLTFLRDIRTQVTPGHVFVTIHLSAPVQFQTQHDADHIYVDLHGVQLSPLMKATTVSPAGPIAQFKLTAAGDPDVIRLSMLLDAPCTFLESITSDPQAIVLDVQPQKGIRPGR